MCGIAGTLDFRAAPIAEEPLRRACEILHHRGPDDRGVLVDPGSGNSLSVGLAAVRLAVIDPTPAGQQPLHVGPPLEGSGRYVIVYNGEVYNHRELRAELVRAGWSFATQTDTETVAAACAHWGASAFARFNGMFALAFFDRRERRGFLARDPYGIKPLLVAREHDRVHFASEMTALRSLGGWDRAIDQNALLHYLHFGYVPAPRTIYADAIRVPPGTYLTFDKAGLHDPVTYVENSQTPTPSLDYSAATSALRSALANSVARRRIADVPLGTFLSGGIDSAVIAHHLAQCTPGPIRTFAIGFRDHPRYDETRYARIMADRLGSEHHELHLGFSDVIAALPDALDRLGEPFFDSSIVPTALVARLAREHVTVCLSGDGGDELFGGYWRYLGHTAANGYARIPGWLRDHAVAPLLNRAASSKSSAWGNRIRQVRKLLRAVDETPIRRHLRWSAILDASTTSILRNTGASERIFATVEAEYARVTSALPDGDPLNRILAFDLRYGLPGDMLHKVDLASMWHSLEVRVPFLDPEVVAVAESCPSSFKIDRGLRKRLLVDAYRGHLPDAILDRGKMGFELPVGEFLRSELRDLFCSTVTRERLESFGVIDPAAVERVYADHCARRGEHADLLVALLSLCWWQSRSDPHP